MFLVNIENHLKYFLLSLISSLVLSVIYGFTYNKKCILSDIYTNKKGKKDSLSLAKSFIITCMSIIGLFYMLIVLGNHRSETQTNNILSVWILVAILISLIEVCFRILMPNKAKRRIIFQNFFIISFLIYGIFILVFEVLKNLINIENVLLLNAIFAIISIGFSIIFLIKYKPKKNLFAFE
jgi:hypothetical protein